MTKLCIYHGNCADGFSGAWVVRRALGDGVDYYPGVYQTPPPDVGGRDVVLVDFSYKRGTMEWERYAIGLWHCRWCGGWFKLEERPDPNAIAQSKPVGSYSEISNN